MSFTPRLHPLDLAVILAFLAVNVVVGFWHRGRSQSFIEYAVGDKKFSTAVLTATIVATWMSGSIFFLDLENTYTKGLYYIIAAAIGAPAGLLITGLVIGPRMGKFLNKMSVPDVLGTYYGPHVRIIAGISVALASTGYIAMQFEVITKIVALLFGYHGPLVTVVTAILLILYSASGGVRSVTFTDVIQFFTFGMLLPILALAVWNRMEAPPLQVSSVLNNNPLFSFREVVQWTPEFRATLVLLFYIMNPSLPPELFQRMVMARSVKQIRQSFIWATVLCLAVEFFLIWLAILLFSENAGLEKEQVVPYLVERYAYPGLKGFLGIGVVALAMSTVDSVLNSTAVVIVHDVLPSLSHRYKASVHTARIATVGLGLTALVLTFQLQDLLDTLLLAANFYAPIVLIPALLTIFGFKTSRRVVLLAMGTGALVVFILLVSFHDLNSFFPGMLANLAVMLGAHYGLGEEGGWGHNPLPKSDAISADAAPFYTNHQ